MCIVRNAYGLITYQRVFENGGVSRRLKKHSVISHIAGSSIVYIYVFIAMGNPINGMPKSFTALKC